MLSVLVGLFIGTAPCLSFAANAVVTPQNAWEYMESSANLAPGELQKFQDKFGSEKNDLSVIPCGRKTCNLNTHICMKRVETKRKGRIEKTFYVCIDREDGTSIQNYKKEGYVEDTEGGLQSKVKYDKQRNQIQKTKSKDLKDKDCYKAAGSSETETKKYCVKVIGSEMQVYSVAGNKEGSVWGCDVIPVRYYNNRECRFCQMIGFLYHSVDDITVKSYNALGKSFAVVLLIGMALWIALKTLNFVSSLTKQDAAKYITEMLQQGYKFMIAYFALIYYDDVFKLIIEPLLVAGLQFGKEFVEVESIAHRFGLPDSVTSTLSVFKNPAQYGDVIDAIPSEYNENTQNVFYSFKIFETMENFAYNVNLQYTLLQVIGSGLNCIGWKYILGRFSGNSWEFGLGVGCLIYGLAFSVFGFLLCLGFIFYLLDAVVQLGFVGALLPFLIASWPFKMTSKYTSTGFKLLLNSIFTFVMMGVVVKVGMELVNMAMELNTEGGDQTAETSPMAVLIEALDTRNTEVLKQMVNVLSIGFLLFLFANIMGFLLLGRVSELTDKFASGGMKASAPAIATMGASTVKGMANKISQPTREAIGDWAEDKAQAALGVLTGKNVHRRGNPNPAGGGSTGSGGSGGSGGGSGEFGGGPKVPPGGGSGGEPEDTEEETINSEETPDTSEETSGSEEMLVPVEPEGASGTTESTKKAAGGTESSSRKPVPVGRNGAPTQPEEGQKPVEEIPAGEAGEVQSETGEPQGNNAEQETPDAAQPENEQAEQPQNAEAAKPESTVTPAPKYGKPDYAAETPKYSHSQGNSNPDTASKGASGQKGRGIDSGKLDNLE